MISDRTSIRTGLTYAAWGYLFLHVDVNIGSISILPAFVGDLLLIAAIRYLSSVRRDLGLLKPLLILMAVWHGIQWVPGLSQHVNIPFFDLLFCAVAVYFHFQFLTDMAALATELQPPEAHLDKTLLRFRTLYALFFTVAHLVQYGNPILVRYQAIMTWVLIGGAIIWLLVAIALMVCLFSLRNCVGEEPAEQTAELPPKE